MTATLCPLPKFRAFDSNGAPLAGGFLWSYAAGTTTPLATYTDQGGGTQNANPVQLDANGEANVWLGAASYKLKLTDSAGVVQWTVDNVQDSGAQALASLADTSSASNGDALLGVKQPFTGAVARTQHQKNLEFVSVLDFGAVGNGSTDDTAAIQAAANAGGVIRIPAGKNCKVTSPVTMSVANTQLVIEPGASVTFTQAMGTVNVTNHGFILAASGCSIVGGGKLIGPAVWDGENSSTNISALVHITADSCYVEGVTLYGVPRFGVSFYGAQIGRVTHCSIYGLFPAASYTGTATSQFGINIDPPSGNPANREYLIEGNTIESCIQGVFWGDTASGGGSATGSSGTVIVGNAFVGCHNHGVYLNGGVGHVVSSNSFSHCCAPIVVNGSYHVVESNVLTTSTTGGNLDQTSINLRNPIGCIVKGNVIQGDGGTAQTILAVNVDGANVVIKDNLIEGNVIECPVGSSYGISINQSQAATTVENNAIRGNKIKAKGASTLSLIYVASPAGNPGTKNVVADNTIVSLDYGYGIRMVYQDDFRVTGNTWELGAGTASPVSPISWDHSNWGQVSHNKIICPTSGPAVSIRALSDSAGCNYNTVDHNDTYISATQTVTWYQDINVPATNTWTQNRCGVDPLYGSVTLGTGSPTTTVTNKNAQLGATVLLTPTSAAAGTLLASKGVYVTVTAGTGFNIIVADATNAGAGCTFNYQIL